MAAVDWRILKKYQEYNLGEKRYKKILFLLGYYHDNDEIIINTKTPFL